MDWFERLCRKFISLQIIAGREGDERIRSGFLLFGKEINDEFRCCRKAVWKERLTAVHQPFVSYLEWKPIEWVG